MLKAVIVGCGFISDFHAYGYENAQGVRLVAVCDASGDKANALADKYGCVAYTDAEVMFREQRPELASICLPTFLHEEYTLQALRAGAHVLCEKPLSLTMDGCRRMAEEAKRAKRVLMAGHVLRFWPEYVRIRELLRDGGLGKPMMLQALRLKQPSPRSWSFDPKLGGGALFDLFIHDLDFVCSLLGTHPVGIHAVGAKAPEGSWHRVSTMLRWANGACAQLDTGSLMPVGFPFTTSFRAECKEGCLEYRFRAPRNIDRNANVDAEFKCYQSGEILDLPMIPDAQGEAFKAEVAAFARGVREGVSPLPIEDAIAVMELLHRIKAELEAE